MSNLLVAEKQKRLAILESEMADISKEFTKSFSYSRDLYREFGKRLKEIKGGLFEVCSPSFVDYVETRMGMKKSWAYLLIKAADSPVVEQLSLPASYVARLPKDPGEQAEVMDRAKSLAEERHLDAPRREEVQDAATTAELEKPEPANTEDGDPDRPAYPANVAKALAEARRLREIASDIGKIIKLVRELGDETVGRFLPVSRIITELKNAKNTIKFNTPHSPCVYCGMKNKGCNACNPEGSDDPQLWISYGVFCNAPDGLVEGARKAGLLKGIKK